MATPLVSVICLSYNHERFVEEAVQSVLNQTYTNIELIIVDDASTDLSQQKIQSIVARNPKIKTLLLNQNVGNCKAFNQGLVLAKGEYIIDFAADDILLPSCIEVGVKDMQEVGAGYGVHFSDAEWIDEDGKHLYFHSDKFPHATIPQGDIYQHLIDRYFICPASIIVRSEVFTFLNGYDETLAYEDFDFLIRSSRQFKFVYSPTVLVKKRVTTNALSKKQFQLFTRHTKTTYIVCRKVLGLNRSRSEQRALSNRIFYEIKLNLRLLNFRMALKYLVLWLENKRMNYDR